MNESISWEQWRVGIFISSRLVMWGQNKSGSRRLRYSSISQVFSNYLRSSFLPLTRLPNRFIWNKYYQLSLKKISLSSLHDFPISCFHFYFLLSSYSFFLSLPILPSSKLPILLSSLFFFLFPLNFLTLFLSLLILPTSKLPIRLFSPFQFFLPLNFLPSFLSLLILPTYKLPIPLLSPFLFFLPLNFLSLFSLPSYSSYL